MFSIATILNTISDKTMHFFRNSHRYFLVFLLFLLAFFYHYFVIPPETQKKDKASKDKVQTEEPNLDAKNLEKIYPRIFQSQAGDVFRVGAFTSTKNVEDVEVFAESGLNEVLKIGEWNLQPSENGEYKELFFVAPGRYEDIAVRLKKNEEREAVLNQKWDDSGVYISSFSASRIEVKNALELQGLNPTVFGISSMKKERLLSKKDVRKEPADQNNSREWVFQLNGDFLEALEFSGKTVGSGRQEYIFKLMRYSPDKKEVGELLHTSSFVLDSLNDLLTSTGNYQMPFSFPLKQGEWYKITFTQTPSKDRDNFFTIGPLKADSETVTDDLIAEDLVLLIGERLRTKNDAIFQDGAKLEDLGKNLSYSFSLQGTSKDFTNIFDASSSIKYDAKKQLVVGDQKNRQYFIYKFDMPYSFDRFVLEAMQEGNEEKEIKLEYSFDNAFWREITFTQGAGDSQKFLLALDGDGKLRTVYVRASYNGPDKKSGFFALKTLNVNASMRKTR